MSHAESVSRVDIAFICSEVENSENIEVRLLAGGLKHFGFEAVVVPARNRTDQIRAVREAVSLSPLVLAFHVQYPANSLLELSVASYARQLGYSGFIVCAGPMPTLQPDWVLRRASAIDGIIRYDAVEPLCKLILAVKEKCSFLSVPSLQTRELKTAVEPSTTSPYWYPVRHSQPQIMGIPTAGVSAVRGCTFRCDYCVHAAVDSLNSKELAVHGFSHSSHCLQKRRDLSDLADEMESLYREQDVRYFYFHDSNPLPANEQQALAWLRTIRKQFKLRNIEDLSFSLNTRGSALTPLIIKELTDMGLVRTLTGIESLTQFGLGSLGRSGKANRAIQSIKLLHDKGVIVWFNILLLHQDSTFKSITEELKYLKTVKAGLFNALKVHPYANSSLEQKLKDAGRLVGGNYLSQITFTEPTVDRFSRMLSAFQAKILGPYDPGLRLQDLMLSAVLAGRHAKKLRPKKHTETILRNLALGVNKERIDALELILNASLVNDDPSPLFSHLKNRFKTLVSEMDQFEIELEEYYGAKADTFFKNVAAAAVLAFSFAGSNACNTVNDSKESIRDTRTASDENRDFDSISAQETDSETDMTADTETDADADSDADFETDVDTEAATDTDEDNVFCKDDETNTLYSIYQSNCGGSDTYAGATFYIDENGKVEKVELVSWNSSDEDVETAVECYEEILKDEVFPCLAGEDINFYVLFIV